MVFFSLSLLYKFEPPSGSDLPPNTHTQAEKERLSRPNAQQKKRKFCFGLDELAADRVVETEWQELQTRFIALWMTIFTHRAKNLADIMQTISLS